MESQPDAQFKPRCPFCAGSYGAPSMVTMRSQHRTITYGFGACKNTWTEADHAPPVVAVGERSPQADRAFAEHAMPSAT